jgi:hypothetical protein
MMKPANTFNWQKRLNAYAPRRAVAVISGFVYRS